MIDPDVDRPRSGHRRHLVGVLPIALTIANIVLGTLAILLVVAAAGERSDPARLADLLSAAAWTMAFGMILDVLDGVAARATGTTSAIGNELDSLADLVTFGVGPAVLAVAFAGGFLGPGEAGPLALRALAVVVACAYVVCAAYRLARFKQDGAVLPSNPPTGPGRFFAGMPSTPAAGMAVVVVALRHGQPPSTNAGSLAYLALMAVLGALMASRWRYRSQRDVFIRPRTPLAAGLFGLTAIGLVLATTWALFIVAATYMVSGIVARVRSIPLGRAHHT